MKHELSNMMCLDIYLDQMDSDSYQELEPQLSDTTLKSYPLMSWDFFMDNYHEKLENARKGAELDQVLAMAHKFGWTNDIKALFLEHDYDALVVTDRAQNIIWVNEGFTQMTGYTKKFSLHKTPGFLQGPKTSNSTKQRIREHITSDRPFKEVIINYKKDQTVYTCEVKVIPLKQDHTTHFIAFEKEIAQ